MDFHGYHVIDENDISVVDNGLEGKRLKDGKRYFNYAELNQVVMKPLYLL